MTKPDLQTQTAPAPVHVPLDEQLRQAWERYGNVIYVVCALIALSIIAKGTWDYLAHQKEVAIERDYAASQSPESLKTFAAAHRGHSLAGLAELRLADDSYAAGKYDAARASYQDAISDLPSGPFLAHAKIGLAVSQALSGKPGEGEAALRQLLNDTTQLKAVRCEAGFHLASIAAQAGRAAEVQTLAEQLMTIDPTSPYSERAFAIRGEMPAK